MTNATAKLDTLEVYCFRDVGRPAFKHTRRLRVITSGIDAGKFCVYSKGSCILVREILGPNKVRLDLQTPRIPRSQTRDALLRDIGLPLPRPLSLPFNPELQKSSEKMVKDERHEAWLLDNEVESLETRLEIFRKMVEETLETVRLARVAMALRSVVELPPSTSAMLRWLRLLMRLTVIVDAPDGLPDRSAE
jgi:hypothetical protein